MGDRQLADSEQQLTDMIRGGIPFSNAPGVAYEYSNYGFAILGRIVSRVSGMPYTDYVTANVIRPLGMTSTTLEPSKVPADRLAHGYRWEDERWKDEPLLANGSFGSMGGMLTTVADLSRYVAAFLSAWPPRDGDEQPPLRRASLREMQQVWRPASAAVTRDAGGALQMTSGGYGFGLRISQTCTFPFVVAHSGGLPGFGSQMRWLPDYGVGIVAFGNLTYTGWGRTWTRCSRPSITRRSRAADGAAIAGARVRARCGRSPRGRLGRCGGRSDRRGEPVPGREQGAPPCGNRGAARLGRRVPCGRGVRDRRERPPGGLDDGLRSRGASGGDHARADEPAKVQFMSIRPAPADVPKTATCPR